MSAADDESWLPADPRQKPTFPSQTRAFAIYVFGPSPEGKFYVGQTTDFVRRFNAHKKATGECPEFHRAVTRFGLDSFGVSIVAETDAAEEADRLEALYITKFNSLIPHGYNLTVGGRGVRFVPGAKVDGFEEHPVADHEFRAMAEKMADPESSEAPGIECPCCGEYNNGRGCDCRCGVAPVLSRLLLKSIAAGMSCDQVSMLDQTGLFAEWRESRDADFFLECEKRGVKGRTFATVGPIAMQKYASRFWPYLNSAVRQRCLMEKKLPCFQLGRFRPVPGGKLVETKRIQIEKLLRRYRRELGPGSGNISVFERILSFQKRPSGKLFDAVIETLLNHGGTMEEVAEADRRNRVAAEFSRIVPQFSFVGEHEGVAFVDNVLHHVRFSDRTVMERELQAIGAAPEQDRTKLIQSLLSNPPSGISVVAGSPRF